MRHQFKIEVLENAPVPIALHNTEQNILWVNRAYQKATGLFMEKLKGKKCYEAWGLKTLCQNCPVTTALETGSETEGEMFYETQPDWQKAHGSWLVKATPLKDKHGRITSVIEIAVEITKMKIKWEEKIVQEKERFLAIVYSALDAIIMIDEEGKVVYWNPAAERIFGYSSEEMMGKDVHMMLMPEQYRKDYQKGFELFKKTRAGYAVGRVLELTAKKKSGEVVPIEIAVCPIRKENAFQTAAIIRDISKRKAKEEKIEHQTKILSGLYGIANRINETTGLIDKAKEVVRACVETFGITFAWIGYAEEDGSITYLNHFPEEISYLKEITVRWDESEYGMGPTSMTIKKGIPQICQDMLSDSIFSPWKNIAVKFGFKSSAALPLVTRRHIFGALNLYSDKINYFTRERLEYLQSLAHIAASALENARLFEESNVRIQRLSALRNIDITITGVLDIRIVYRIILEEIINQLNIDAALILILNPYNMTLNFTAEKGFRNKAIKKISLPVEQTITEKVVKEHRLDYISDITQVEINYIDRDMYIKEGLISYYGAPLIAKGEFLGVLALFKRKISKDSEEWLDFLETLSGQVAIAIENARLVENLRIKHAELLKAYDETIEGWGTALSLKEEETAEHSHRVTQVTFEIAKRMGIKDEDLIHIRRGALLHDIGKIGIPDSILLKQGKLTEEEWEIMKRHPEYAFQMLSPISYLSKAVEIPYCHHEKWDGTGYPRGLKGKQIPLAARIFAVVDVWDALTADRPYRKAWPKEKVIEYIKEWSGIHFDPEVVKVFIKDNKHFSVTAT